MKKSEESNEMLNKFILRINVEMSSLKQARVMTVEL